MIHFARNIKLLRKRRERSQEEVAIALDLKRSTWSGYEIGTAEPSLTVLLKISGYFKVTIDKLLKHDLIKLPESKISQLERGMDIDIAGDNLRVLATTVNSDNEENIELLPEKAKAGYKTGYSDPEYIKVLPTFSMPFLSKQKKYRTFQISGDSMPPITNGSWVTGEYVQNWNSLKNGHPYIILTKEDGIVFKTVYNRLEQNKSLLLVSTNKLFEPYEIQIDQVMEVWKFVHYICNDF
jgi:transcriptional regulator with XRE-family HTH domain